MNLSLSSLSILGAALTFTLLGACTNPVILATGGSGGGSTSTASTASTSGSTTTGAGGSNACTAVGGKCEFTGESCDGTHASGIEAAACGAAVGAFCCLASPTNPTGTGGSSASCDHPCAVETLGATQCAGNNIETCTVVGDCSVWKITAACGLDQGCDDTATKCISSLSDACTPGAPVGCGCGCGTNGTVECTGGLPPSCAADSDCGPTCSGFVCSSQQCVPWVCNPGADAMCNESASMSALAGSCSADGTCACKTGFTRQADGKCG